MRTFWPCLCAMGLMLFVGPTAWANPITFTIDFNTVPSGNFTGTAILGNGGLNQIDLTNLGPHTFTANVGSMVDVVGYSMTVHNSHADTFTYVPFVIGASVTSGSQSGSTTLFGFLSGSIDATGKPSLSFQWPPCISGGMPPFSVNGNYYDIRIDSYVPPGPYNPNPALVDKGYIDFSVGVSTDRYGVIPPVSTSEPSSLLLFCVGLGSLGLGWWCEAWWVKRHVRASPPPQDKR